MSLEVKPVPDCPGYFATNDNEVYKIKKVPAHINNSGYLKIRLTNSKGKRFFEVIHRTIYRAFHPGENINGFEIDHNDKNKKNNTPLNLEKVTQLVNIFRRDNGYSKHQQEIQGGGDPF